MKQRMTRDEAISLLREKHAEAEINLFVNDPVSYALYYTWREVDEKNRRTE